MGSHSCVRQSCSFAVALAVALCCGCSDRAPSPGFKRVISSGGYFKSYMNRTPPELAAGGEWINADEPLSLNALKGRVVWLEFSFLD